MHKGNTAKILRLQERETGLCILRPELKDEMGDGSCSKLTGVQPPPFMVPSSLQLSLVPPPWIVQDLAHVSYNFANARMAVLGKRSLGTSLGTAGVHGLGTTRLWK